MAFYVARIERLIFNVRARTLGWAPWNVPYNPTAVEASLWNSLKLSKFFSPSLLRHSFSLPLPSPLFPHKDAKKAGKRGREGEYEGRFDELLIYCDDKKGLLHRHYHHHHSHIALTPMRAAGKNAKRVAKKANNRVTALLWQHQCRDAADTFAGLPRACFWSPGFKGKI